MISKIQHLAVTDPKYCKKILNNKKNNSSIRSSTHILVYFGVDIRPLTLSFTNPLKGRWIP